MMRAEVNILRINQIKFKNEKKQDTRIKAYKCMKKWNMKD